MRLVRTQKEFLREVCSKKQVVIYGAGKVGKLVFKYLKDREIFVEAFAVTVNPENSVGDMYEISVCCLDDILKGHQPQDIIIVLAVAGGENRISMEKELKNRKVAYYIKLSDALLYEMAWENRKSDAARAESDKVRSNVQKTVGYLFPGYLDTDYAEKRLVVGKINSASYVALPKETARIACVGTEYEKNLELHRLLAEACYCPERYIPDVSMIHTFNSVCDTVRPWCASFETTIPRVRPQTEDERKYFLYLVDCIKRPNCKALYALCQKTYDIQKNYLMSVIPPEDAELVMSKTRVLHPPQDILIEEKEFERKHNLKIIHFVFIGTSFFIKGGREIIQVLSEFEDKYEFRLTLISSLLYNDYFTKTPYEEMVRCREIIYEKTWIDYYESLPNKEVLEKCRKATVGLLPSVADTYGYAVLEMQAAGCPVITTNVRAFPETNNEECGWVCTLPLDEMGRCAERDASVWSEILRKELRRCFQEIFDHPDIVKEKGSLAMERIRKMHDAGRYQEELLKAFL